MKTSRPIIYKTIRHALNKSGCIATSGFFFVYLMMGTISEWLTTDYLILWCVTKSRHFCNCWTFSQDYCFKGFDSDWAAKQKCLALFWTNNFNKFRVNSYMKHLPSLGSLSMTLTWSTLAKSLLADIRKIWLEESNHYTRPIFILWTIYCFRTATRHTWYLPLFERPRRLSWNYPCFEKRNGNRKFWWRMAFWYHLSALPAHGNYAICARTTPCWRWHAVCQPGFGLWELIRWAERHAGHAKSICRPDKSVADVHRKIELLSGGATPTRITWLAYILLSELIRKLVKKLYMLIRHTAVILKAGQS